MNWLNLPVSTARHPAFIGCDPVARATWLSVLLYCVEQENGGVLKGARDWKDRRWQQTCGVTLQEVDSAQPLLAWKGGNLVVTFYPKDKQREVQHLRKLGKVAGVRSGEARRVKRETAFGATAEEPPGSTGRGDHGSGENGSFASTEGERERKEKEKGKKRNNSPADTPAVRTATSLLGAFPNVAGEREKKEKEGKAIHAEELSDAARPEKDGKGSREEVTEFFLSLGMTTDDAEWFFDKCEGCGWKNAGKPILNWKATVRAWKRISIFPSQKPHGRSQTTRNGTERNIGHNAGVDYSQRPLQPQTSADWST